MKKIRESKKLIATAVLTSFLAIPTTTFAADTRVNVTTDNVSISGISNSSFDGQGGAVNAVDVSNLTISGTFSNNSATGQGGAISLNKVINAHILGDSKFIGNHSTTTGAISAVASTWTIGDNVTFDGNYSETYSGAILNQESNLTIGDNVVFKNNISNITSGSDSGAALAIDDHAKASTNSTIKIGNNALFENNSSGKSGGGVYIYEHIGKINLKLGSKATFKGNKAVVNGAGMAIYGATGTNPDSTNTGVTIGEGAIFENNIAQKSGGGIYVQNWNNQGTKLTIANGASFKSNSAGENGGAIYNACSTEIDNATFLQNSATGHGGAIYNTVGTDGNVTASMTITNSKFTGNSAGKRGGAIYNDATLVVGGNFANNHANSYGGAIYNAGNLTITEGSTFTGNTSDYVGGAIAVAANENATLTIKENVSFENNSALYDGGALGNYYATTIANGAQFINNKAQIGTSDTQAIGGGAMSLGAESKTKLVASTFTGNTSGYDGGAIGTRHSLSADNSGSGLTIENSTFSGNKALGTVTSTQGRTDTPMVDVAGGNGGAIANHLYKDFDGNSSVKISGSTFTNNTAAGNGGAIYNSGDEDATNGTASIIIANSEFTGNSAGKNGGAIYNASKMYLDTTNGDITFTNNTDSTGKNDIYMADSSDLTLLGNQNVTIGSGLASENENATITNNGVNFIFADNAINAYDGKYIHNAGKLVLGENVALFKDYAITSGNGAELIVDETSTLQSTLNVDGNDSKPVTDLANVQFNGEITPTGTSSIAEAIRTGNFTYNGTAVDIDGAGLTLSNNTIIDEDLIISGTEAGGVRFLGFGEGSGTSGNITLGDNTGLQYKDGAYINNDSTLTMGNGASLIFNNDSSSIDYDVTITSSDTNANIIMNGEGTTNISSALSENINIQANSGTLNLTKAELTVGDLSVKGEDTSLNLLGNVIGGNVDVDKATLGVFGNSKLDSLSLGSTLAMQNGVINNLNVGTFSLNADSNITFDVDPRTGLTDTINANTFTNTADSNLLVTGITLTQAPTSSNFNINLDNILTATNGDTAGVIQIEDSIIANSQMGRYLISSSGTANSLTATLMNINPQMYRGQVATIASWQNQLVVNNMLFDHMNVLANQLLDETKTANLKAAAYPQFAPYQYSAKDGSLWYKAYGNFERLSMTQGLSVGNNAYGSLIGADFPLVDLKNGWKLVPTAYIGYNGAHQHFNGVRMYQNGAQLGAMGTLYKGDFITSLLAYAGGYANDMKVSGIYGSGNDTTGNWFAGVASKTAYNIHLPKDFIFQPTAMIAYNAFGSQNWGSNFGGMSMSSGMLNGINIAPGFNLIWNKKTFSLYATAQMVYNIMGNVDGQAGNIYLDDVKMRHAYFEYGIGAMKKIKDRFNGYIQITVRNGGRTGIGFQGGIQIKVGK